MTLLSVPGNQQGPGYEAGPIAGRMKNKGWCRWLSHGLKGAAMGRAFQ